MSQKSDLKTLLTRIKEGPMGLPWVARETGIAESKLRSFIGSDLLTPEDSALTEDEVKLLMGWYFFGT